jgi:hypothetical protein
MRVVHVAPTAFRVDALFGGGERYPLALARALAREPDFECELVTFGRSPGDLARRGACASGWCVHSAIGGGIRRTPSRWV